MVELESGRPPPSSAVTAPVPFEERRRVAALEHCGVMDTGPEESFDELARLLARVCETPIAVISFIDSTRQWNKSRIGLEIEEIPRSQSICARTIMQNNALVVADCVADSCVREALLVRGEGIRFYAGAPIRTAEGLAVGCVAVMDRQPRALSQEKLEAIKTMARQAAMHLASRRTLLDLRQKQSLTESEAFHRALVESLPQNIFRKDTEGRFTFANNRFCSLVNRKIGEVIGRTDADLFPPELAAKHRADDLEVMRSLQATDTIERHETAQGQRYVRVIKAPLFSEDGKVTGIQGMFWDETVRFKVEQALANERDLLRALLEHIPDRIYFKDAQSRFICMSSEFARSTGLGSAAEGIGKTDADIFTAEHAEAALRDEQEILRTGQPIIGKVEHETWTDGRETWCLTTKMPLRNPNGETQGTFGISRDITDLKLAEKRLAEARDAALESARLKSEFLANMSHEIRTPMNAIIGMTGLLLDTALSSDQRDFAETIRLSADALLTIINDILDFSKIEAGKLAFETIDFDLRELVEGAADLHAERAQRKGIELAAWIHEETPRNLKGDPGRLRQILTNLLGNAVKFTETGEVVLEVEQIKPGPDASTVRFSVRDTGIGIPLEAQKRIFEAFTQADGSMTRRYGGTGLGLAITKQLIELMSGRIGFASESRKGSTFWFEIPLPHGWRADPVAARLNQELEGVRVLIVDDNATNRRILRHQTGAWRMRNETAASADEALDWMRKAVAAGDPFKLVLLDMQMPVTDGIMLANLIKSEPSLAGAALVMLTSLGYLPSERLWREVGISAYLIKPVKQSRLFDVIAEVMSSPQTKGEAKQEEKPAPAEVRKGTVRVLLAEDNPVNQKVALRQLTKLGFPVDAVNNGLEAVQAIERFVYPLILMDCQMPEMDGYKATAKIRELQAASPFRWSHRPYIIAMTANALAGDREACIAAGMDDYISKPVRIDELEAALDRGIKAMESGQNQTPPPTPDGPPVDRNVLENLRELRMEGEPDPLAELVELFLQDTPERISQMRSALERADAPGLEAAAHSLKGSASNLGARPMAADCARLMRQGKKGEFAAAAGLVRAVEENFGRVKEILLEEIRR